MIHLNHKHIQAVLVLLVVWFEWRSGYFRGFLKYLKSFSIKPYARLIFQIFLVTALLFALDPFLIRWVQSFESPFSSWIVSVGSFFGRKNWWVLLFTYLAVLIVRAQPARKLIFSALAANAITALFCVILKFTVLRARPLIGLGAYSFFNFEGVQRDAGVFQSFPSGDVAIVAGAAAYFFYAFRSWFLRLFVFLFPLATAFARMSLNKHWPSDVFFAIGLGLVSAQFVWQYQKSHLPVPARPVGGRQAG